MKELVLDIWAGNRGIDLAAWKSKRGVWGVIVKMGGHEYLKDEYGNLQPFKTYYEDSQRDAHYEKVRSLGIHVGAFYYGSATSVQEAKQEAGHCIDLLKGRFLDLPVYYDVEERDQLEMGDLSGIVRAFCDNIDGAGYRAGIYSGRDGFSKMGDVDRYALWVASWQETWPKWARDFGMWQQGTMRLSDGAIEYDDVYEVDFNWCQIDYPSRGKTDGGTTVAKLSYGDAAAEVMDHFIDHDAHGYSQINRDGTADVETITLSDGTQVSFQSGDRDCSRLVQTCNVVIGALPRGMHMWTGNEREILLENGFVEVSLDEVQRGDVLWRQGHTELYLGDGIEGGARRSEYHSIDGQTGDQDGEEIARSAYVKGHWTNAYRCTKVRPDSKPAPTPSKSKVKAVTRGVYRVYDAPNSRHHWTSDAEEAQKLVDAGWTYEGVAWKSSATGSKVYRAYNPKTGDHLLCTDAARMLNALGKGWRYEGVAFLAGGKKPVYELYDSGHKEHFYTASLDERNTCKGWMSDKGIGFYV